MSVAPELRVVARQTRGGTLELVDLAQLVEAVPVTRNRRWRRRAIEHVSRCSGVPVRDVIRELERAERRAS